MSRLAESQGLFWTLDQWAICGGWLEQSGYMPLPTMDGAERAQRTWYMAYSAPPGNSLLVGIDGKPRTLPRNTSWAARVMRSIALA